LNAKLTVKPFKQLTRSTCHMQRALDAKVWTTNSTNNTHTHTQSKTQTQTHYTQAIVA